MKKITKKTLQDASLVELEAEIALRKEKELEEARRKEAEEEALLQKENDRQDAFIKTLEARFERTSKEYNAKANVLQNKIRELKHDVAELAEEYGFPGNFGNAIYKPKSYHSKWIAEAEETLDDEHMDEVTGMIEGELYFGQNDYDDGWWQPSAYC